MTVLNFLETLDTLRRIPRMGWLIQGLSPSVAEDIASHSFSTTVVSYLLARLDNEDIDYHRLLLMALVHDLPEAKVGDIPGPALKGTPELLTAKKKAENRAIEELLKGLPKELSSDIKGVWKEFNNSETREAHIVEAADRLATALQAYHLISLGYSPERFKLFINWAKKRIDTLEVPSASKIIAEIQSATK